MSADIELKWEWPADRKITDRLLIKVDSIRPKSSGFFGVGGSPSLAESVPDPMILSGVVTKGGDFTDGKSIRVVVPKLEIGIIKRSTYAMLGIVEKDTCICIIPVDSPDTDISQLDCN